VQVPGPIAVPEDHEEDSLEEIQEDDQEDDEIINIPHTGNL
jgi:hypothetical protein